jgi:hypothetical protein
MSSTEDHGLGEVRDDCETSRRLLLVLVVEADLVVEVMGL